MQPTETTIIATIVELHVEILAWERPSDIYQLGPYVHYRTHGPRWIDVQHAIGPRAPTAQRALLRAVRKLEARGFVLITPTPFGHRIGNVRLTEAGERIAHQQRCQPSQAPRSRPRTSQGSSRRPSRSHGKNPDKAKHSRPV